MKSRLALRAAALAFAALATTACGKISITSYLNVDTNAATPTQITLTGLGAAGADLAIPIGGGLQGTISIDTTKLFSSPNGILGTIVAKNISLAGASADVFGALPTGTLCIRQNPNNPTAGTVLIKLVGQSEAMVDFHAQATNVGGAIPLGVQSFDAAGVELPLTINWSKLLSFNLNGAIKASMSIASSLTVPVLGTVPFTFDSSLTSSTKPPSDPIITALAPDCANAVFPSN